MRRRWILEMMIVGPLSPVIRRTCACIEYRTMPRFQSRKLSLMISFRSCLFMLMKREEPEKNLQRNYEAIDSRM
jgi:hypothetical protein